MTAGGRPEDTPRTVAMARVVAFYVHWTGNPPSKSKESHHFMDFATEVFRLADCRHDVQDLSAHIKKVLKLRSEGANLETWTG
jgi:hypothetical protein